MEMTHKKPGRKSNGYSDNIVAFQLEDQTFALPLETVVQIIPMLKLTPLPQVHPSIAGVMNFRGVAVPVINMRTYLGLEKHNLQLHTPIMLVRMHKRGTNMVGLIVDEVQDVVSIPEGQVIELDDVMPAGLGDVPILQGMLHSRNGATLLLDLEQLLINGPLKDMNLAQYEGDEIAFDQVSSPALSVVEQS